MAPHRGSGAGQPDAAARAARHFLRAQSRHAEAWGPPVAPAPAGRIPREGGATVTSEAPQKQGECGERAVRACRRQPWAPEGARWWRGQWLQSRDAAASERCLVRLLQPRGERTGPPAREAFAEGPARRKRTQGRASRRRPGIRSWVRVPCRPGEPAGVSPMHGSAASGRPPTHDSARGLTTQQPAPHAPGMGLLLACLAVVQPPCPLGAGSGPTSNRRGTRGLLSYRTSVGLKWDPLQARVLPS